MRLFLNLSQEQIAKNIKYLEEFEKMINEKAYTLSSNKSFQVALAKINQKINDDAEDKKEMSSKAKKSKKF